MIDYDNMPDDLPNGYGYLQGKAEVYLEEGPDAYTQQDFFALQAGMDIPESMVPILENGMKQIMDWRGYRQDIPFTKLGIKGFYKLIEILHFRVEQQETCDRQTAGGFLDKMTIVHTVFKTRRLTLYNLVESTSD